MTDRQQFLKQTIEEAPFQISFFMFQLNEKELKILRSHFATSSSWGGRRYPPYVFTEHGAIMAASVLDTEHAIEISVYVVRAFVKLRTMIATHKDLAKKLEELEKKYDSQFRVVFDAIRELMLKPEPKRKKIGFIVKEKQRSYGRSKSGSPGRNTGFKYPLT